MNVEWLNCFTWVHSIHLTVWFFFPIHNQLSNERESRIIQPQFCAFIGIKEKTILKHVCTHITHTCTHTHTEQRISRKIFWNVKDKTQTKAQKKEIKSIVIDKMIAKRKWKKKIRIFCFAFFPLRKVLRILSIIF